MSAAQIADAERRDLAGLFLRLGPDEPTLCGDWSTRELAAHLVLRERRLVAAAGRRGTRPRAVAHGRPARPADLPVEPGRRHAAAPGRHRDGRALGPADGHPHGG